jgi:hypothetical protein
MSKSEETSQSKRQRDKSQDLVPREREPVYQGQQFDEMQRQQKNPDGGAKDENES